MMFNPDTLTVIPFKRDFLEKTITLLMEYNPEEYRVRVPEVAHVNDSNLIMDADSCYWILQKHMLIDGPRKLDHLYSLPVYVSHKNEKGWDSPMFPTFHFDIYMSEFKGYQAEEITMKEFMGSRYDYNPRIIQNQNELLNLINGVNNGKG